MELSPLKRQLAEDLFTEKKGPISNLGMGDGIKDQCGKVKLSSLKKYLAVDLSLPNNCPMN